MIRNADKKDIERIMELLHQVNDVHAEGRPDLFIKGNTKYTPEDLENIIKNPDTPVFVSTDNEGVVEGYGFCKVQDYTSENHLAPIKTLYIDDICVDSTCRGRHVGQQIYHYIREYAKAGGFHNVTLNVWSCNPSAMKFYEKLGLIPYKIGMEDIL